MTWLSAQTVSTWDGTAAIWTQGSGTQADPYLIETAQNLAWISEMVNNGVAKYNGVWFKLTSDLNMRNIAWVPIGNSTTNCFCGKFDGANHFIDSISVTGGYTYKGLFGITGAGFRCENLGVNTNVTSTGNNSGGIVGYVKGANSVIMNCYNTGTLKGSCVGGIVGYNNATGIQIISCYNANTGTINSSYCSGGIIGKNEGSVSIYKCFNEANLYSSKSASSFSVETNCGGIVACNVASSSATISDCYNTGTLSSTSYNSTSSSSYSYALGRCPFLS